MAHTPDHSSLANLHPVNIGNLTYLTLPDRIVFRPAPGYFLLGTISGAIFALILTLFCYATLAMALDLFFGWQFMGLKPEANSSPAPAVLGVLPLGFSVLLGLFGGMMYARLIQLVRFLCQPTVFDFTKGELRCGGREMCMLDEIGEIHLCKTTDPNFPSKMKIALAVALRDGSFVNLEPYSAFLNFLGRIDKRYAQVETDLGMLMRDDQRENAQASAMELANRLNVPLRPYHQIGNFQPERGGMG